MCKATINRVRNRLQTGGTIETKVGSGLIQHLSGFAIDAMHDIREVLQYVITCQNTYVICRRALRQVLVLQHFAALWLDVKAENPGCGLAPSSKQRKVCASHPRVPKSKR